MVLPGENEHWRRRGKVERWKGKGTKLTCGAIFILSEPTDSFVKRQPKLLGLATQMDTIQAAQNVIYKSGKLSGKARNLQRSSVICFEYKYKENQIKDENHQSVQ